jgi:Secretion system C-terminal sorting domain
MKFTLLLCANLLSSVFIIRAQIVFEKKIEYQTYGSRSESVIADSDSSYLLSGISQNLYASTTWGGYITRLNIHGDTLFSKRYDDPSGGPTNFILKKIYEGSYIVTGATSYLNACDGYDIFILKLKLNGDTLWTKHYSTCKSDIPEEIIRGPNNGYYYYGSVKQNGVINLGTCVMRLKANGDTIWTRFINLAGPSMWPLYIQKQENFACAPTEDGGILTSGMVFDSSYYPRSSYIIKLDSNGTVLWKKFIDNPQFNSIMQIIPTHSGYLLQGYCSLNCPPIHNSIYASEFGTMLIKIDFGGNIEWGKMYKSIENGGYPFTVLSKTATLLDDGSVFVANVRQVSPFDFATSKEYHNLIGYKTDSLGNLIWFKKYNINAIDIRPTNVDKTTDKGFIITANCDYSDLNENIYNGLVVKIDSLGQGCDDSTLNMEVTDIISQITTSDTVVPEISYYPVVIKHSPFIYSRKINYTSLCEGTIGIIETEIEKNIDLYPNPATNEIRISSTGDGIKKMKINNVLGGCVYERDVENEKKEISVDVSGLVNGMYFVEVMCENKIYNAKFIKQ